MGKKYLLVDAKNCLYRHMHTSNLSVNGQKISGTFGMMKDVTNLVRQYEPDQVIIAWDKGAPTRRLAFYPAYKANRRDKKEPEFLENLAFQVKQAKELFDCLPVIQISVENTEADDVIGFFVKQLKGEKIIASTDTDFIQLIDEDTKIVKSRKGVVKELTHENINEELGYDKKHYILHKALVGDSSDNIVGMTGIGDKTATKIIKKEVKKPLDLELIKRNITLITICGPFLPKEDVDRIVEVYKKQKTKQPNLMRLRAKMEKLRFNSILSSFQGVMHCYKEMYDKSHQ